MKEQVIKGINKWISLKVDELAMDNVLLTITSGAVKNGLKSMISNVDMSKVIPFITKDGILDAHIITDEIIKSISALSPKEVKIKGVAFTVGNGVVRFKLDNWIGELLGIDAISVTANDIDELAKLINDEV